VKPEPSSYYVVVEFILSYSVAKIAVEVVVMKRRIKRQEEIDEHTFKN
jgi:hypothetical protein